MDNDTALQQVAADLGRAVPSVGTRSRLETIVITDLKFEARAPGVAVSRFRTRSERTTRQVSTVSTGSADAVTALTVHYEMVESRDTPPKGEVRVTSHPVASKTYAVLAAGADKPAVTQPDGSAVDAKESSRVERDFGGLGRPYLFARFLPGRVEPGDAVLVPGPDASEIMGTKPGLNATDVSLVYRGLSDRTGQSVAVFDLALTLDGETGPGMHTRSVLAGQVGVDVETCERAWMVMTGEVEMRGERPHKDTVMKITGSGAMEHKATRAPVV